jgi:hypothetical protein
MRAQVTPVEASPVRLDDAIRFFREQVLPRFRQWTDLRSLSSSVLDGAASCSVWPSGRTKEWLYWYSGCCVSAELTMRRSDRPLWGSDPPSISLVHPSAWKVNSRTSALKVREGAGAHAVS